MAAFIKQLERFKDYTDYTPGTRVSFVASVQNVTDLSNDNTEKISIRVYDGYEPSTLYVYGPVQSWFDILPIGGILRFYGEIREAHKTYVKVDEVEEIPKTEEILKKYRPSSFKRLIEANAHYFVSSIQKVKDEKLRRYIEIAYGLGEAPVAYTKKAYDAIRRKQFGGYASISRHDNYAGGNINHIVGELRQIDALHDIYGEYQVAMPVGRVEKGSVIDWDYLRFLAYMHDIGKQSTYMEAAPGIIRFNKDIKLSHEELGICILTRIHDIVERDKRLSDVRMQVLYYGILHHGDGISFDTQNRCSSEDRIFRYIDGMDTCFVDTLEL